jgi:hypothetical protein
VGLRTGARVRGAWQLIPARVAQPEGTPARPWAIAEDQMKVAASAGPVEVAFSLSKWPSYTGQYGAGGGDVRGRLRGNSDPLRPIGSPAMPARAPCPIAPSATERVRSTPTSRTRNFFGRRRGDLPGARKYLVACRDYVMPRIAHLSGARAASSCSARGPVGRGSGRARRTCSRRAGPCCGGTSRRSAASSSMPGWPDSHASDGHRSAAIEFRDVGLLERRPPVHEVRLAPHEVSSRRS